MLRATFYFDLENLAHVEELRITLARIGGEPGPVKDEHGLTITAARAAQMRGAGPTPETPERLPDGF